MAHVQVCYSSDHTDEVENLLRKLIAGGGKISRMGESNSTDADYIVVLWTDKSVNDARVISEAKLAHAKGKLIQLAVGKVKRAQLAEPMSGLTIYFLDGAGDPIDEKRLRELVARPLVSIPIPSRPEGGGDILFALGARGHQVGDAVPPGTLGLLGNAPSLSNPSRPQPSERVREAVAAYKQSKLSQSSPSQPQPPKTKTVESSNGTRPVLMLSEILQLDGHYISQNASYASAAGTLTQFNAIVVAVEASFVSQIVVRELQLALAAALIAHVLAAFVLCFALRPVSGNKHPEQLLHDTIVKYRWGWRLTLWAMIASAADAIWFLLQVPELRAFLQDALAVLVSRR